MHRLLFNNGFRMPGLMTLPKHSRLRRGVYLGLTVVGVSAIALWGGRFMIARPLIDSWLQSQKIEARYRLDRLGPKGAELSDISLGPASRPEFQAARIRVVWNGPVWKPEIALVEVEQPVLRAALTDEGLSLGSLDRLIPEPSGEALPAMRVGIARGHLLVDTPWGAVRADIEGRGMLRDDFQGMAHVHPAELEAAGCRVRLGATALQFATGKEHATVMLGGELPMARCAGMVATTMAVDAMLRGDPTLRHWTGNMRLSAAVVDGAPTITRPEASIHFTGTAARIRGLWTLRTAGIGGSAGKAQALHMDGKFSVEDARNLLFEGDVEATGVRLPVEFELPDTAPPLLMILGNRLAAAARQSDFSTHISGGITRDELTFHITNANARSATGARLTFGDGAGVRLVSGAWRADGHLQLAGGGLPSATFSLHEIRTDRLGELPTGRIGLVVEPWRIHGGTNGRRHSLAVPELSLGFDGGQITANGRLLYSGATGADMHVDGLDLRIQATGRAGGELRLTSGCATVAFRAVDHASLHLGPAQFTACPKKTLVWGEGKISGEVEVAPLHLAGWAGGEREPLEFTTAALRLRAQVGTYTLPPTRIQMHVGDRKMAGILSARARGEQAAGRLMDIRFTDAALPIDVDSGQGVWRIDSSGVYLVDGTIHIRDRQPRPRFQPLVVEDIAVSFAGGRIHLAGQAGLASQPKPQRRTLARFTAEHALDQGRGTATLDTGDLLFDKGLQPYQISETMRGVIENVRGTLKATAEVQWAGEEVDGSGHISVRDMELATAALGPVSGINSKIEISNLTELRSPPAQEMTIASMNPGILVENGRFLFQLVGGGRIQVEGAQWPFFGGVLSLRPFLFDSGATTRNFTLDVVGMDAGLFLQGFDLEDLHATGTFDGTLPLEFGAATGRITDGVLTARPPGGLLRYVGDVGADQMGAAGQLAFDALKGLRYQAMTLKLAGDLDGELVTEVFLEGRNEHPVGPGDRELLTATGIPFRFNINVRAPFRHLLGTAASFSDARAMIRSAAENGTVDENAENRSAPVTGR